MINIALMTWHHAENYGTAYQAYALKTIIEHQGYHVDLIDYRRLNCAPLEQPKIFNFVKGKIASIFCHIFGNKQNLFQFHKETFGLFYEKHFSYTQKCIYNQDFAELNNRYSGFVCGSDQIWSPNWYDGRFLLDFVVDPRRLIAYAPSLGVSTIANPLVLPFMKELISRFQFLSVREKTGCNVVKELTGRSDVVNVLDPVIMLDAGDWQQLEEQYASPDKYALIFFLANNSTNIKLSINAAKAKDLKPIVLHCTQTEDTALANSGGLTPGQMLSCIRNASYVYTDSFHITVLSIIYHRQFMTFQKKMGRNSITQYRRITDLLERLNIKGGIYNDFKSFEEEIDYKIVDVALTNLRKESLAYLKTALESLPPLEKYTIGECHKVSKCKGECTDSFNKYIEKQSNTSQVDFMMSCQFALLPKCYRCKHLDGKVISDGRMPLFYYELERDLAISQNKVYVDYFRRFKMLNLVKKYGDGKIFFK